MRNTVFVAGFFLILSSTNAVNIDRSTKICDLCLETMVGIIHDLNDSKATILAMIDKECWQLSDMQMQLYRACVVISSKLYLKIVQKMEKQFDPNKFCSKIHACPNVE